MKARCKVFISFSHRDGLAKESTVINGSGYPEAFLRFFRVIIDSHNWLLTKDEIFYDYNRITHEPNWRPEIERALYECDLLIPLLSAHYFHSDACLRELSYAFGRSIPIIPVLLSPTPDWRQVEVGEKVVGRNFRLGDMCSSELPRDESGSLRPVSEWGDEHEAWSAVVKGLSHFMTSTSTFHSHSRPVIRLSNVVGEAKVKEVQDLRTDTVRKIAKSKAEVGSSDIATNCAWRPICDFTWPPEAQRWPPVFPLVCACAWGDDRFGLWIDVVIGGPVQRFRWIEPGEFVMGSPDGEVERSVDEGPQHVVRLTEGFWLADTACSQLLWESVMGDNPSHFKDDPQNPVEQVSWDAVQRFLGEVEKRLAAVMVDLPTEAEWEYACRAGSETVFSWGDVLAPLQVNCNTSISYANGPSGAPWQRTKPVRAYEPNAWGLFQMHGNVWEWCADGARHYDLATQVDPRGVVSEEHGVARGGAWDCLPHRVRAASRATPSKETFFENQGFRFVLRSKSSAEGARLQSDAAG